MAGEWTARKIGSLGRVVTGKTPSTADPANFIGPYPFITIPDLDGRVVIDHAERSLSPKGAEVMRSCLLPPGAVMMSCIATVGRCGLTAIPSFTNQQINSVIPNSNIDPRFLYYVFTQLSRELESAGGGGSVYTNVSKSRFSDIEVMLPEEIKEQRAIAHILGTLDDKIELNRKMNETLEAIAKAIFKSWFVDFDPVRAKAEGRKPVGMDEETAALFPDSFEDSELGKIPKGWEVKAIGDLVKCVKGKSYKSEDLQDSRTALVTLKSFYRGGGYRPDGLKAYTGDFKAEQVVRPGELIVACTDVTQAAEVIGRPALVQSTDDFTTLVASLDIMIVRPCVISVSVPLLYYLFRTDEFTAHTYAHSTGTTVLHLSKEAVPSYKFALPSVGLREEFASITLPVFERIDTNESESRTLASLRDALLPKLLSGEIRVKEAEKVVESVT